MSGEMASTPLQFKGGIKAFLQQFVFIFLSLTFTVQKVKIRAFPN